MGHAYQSPLRRWEVLAGIIEQSKATTFVEVGCKEGRTTGFLLDNFPHLHVVAIDPWAPVANDDEDYSTWNYEEIERDFWANVGEHRARCTMLRMTSDLAAKEYMPHAPDVVFIDAGHDHKSALADIKLWWPKVAKNGYLTGHDYQHQFPGVMRAVAEVFPLIRVALCPDSVWVVQKEPDLRAAA